MGKSYRQTSPAASKILLDHRPRARHLKSSYSVGLGSVGGVESSRLLDGPATRAIHAAEIKPTEFQNALQVASVISRIAAHPGIRHILFADAYRECRPVNAERAPGQERRRAGQG